MKTESQIKSIKRMMRRRSVRRARERDGGDEARRSNRLAALLAIAASVFAGIRFIFPYMSRIWTFLSADPSTENLVHWLIAFLAASIIALVAVDLIEFFFADMKRYDVSEETVTSDKNSDNCYRNLLFDFRECIYIILLLLFLLSFFETLRSGNVFLTCVLSIVILGVFGVAVYLMVGWISKNKGNYKKVFGALLERLVRFFVASAFTFIITVFVTALCISDSITILNKNTGEIVVSFFSGKIDAKMEIIVEGDDGLIAQKKIDLDKSMGGCTEANYLMGERNNNPIDVMYMHDENARFELDLRELEIEEGNYKYTIVITTLTKSITCECSFYKNKYNRYIFANDSIRKDF